MSVYTLDRAANVAGIMGIVREVSTGLEFWVTEVHSGPIVHLLSGDGSETKRWLTGNSAEMTEAQSDYDESDYSVDWSVTYVNTATGTPEPEPVSGMDRMCTVCETTYGNHIGVSCPSGGGTFSTEPVSTPEVDWVGRQTGPEAFAHAGIGGTVESDRSGNLYVVDSLEPLRLRVTVVAPGNSSYIGNVIDSPADDIRWTIRSVGGAVVAPEPTTSPEPIAEPEPEKPATQLITAADATVGMFIIPTPETVSYHGMRSQHAVGFMVDAVRNDATSVRLSWESGNRRMWFNLTDTFTTPVFEPEELAAWLVAEAQWQAKEVGDAAMRASNDERKAFHAGLRAERERVRATEENAMRERNDAVRELRETKARLQQVETMWTPGGIVNKVACMRGDITAQCSELDRTLRGIGWYDRDGRNQNGETLDLAREIGRDWYKSRWYVPVTNIVTEVNGVEITVPSVMVTVSAGSADRAAEKVGSDAIVEALNEKGLEVNYISDWTAADCSDVEPAENSYSVDDFTD